jgi:undecaprenyl-diphosphatase
MLGYLEHLDHQLFFALNNGLSSSPLAPVLDALFWVFATLGNGVGMLCWALIGLWLLDRLTLKQHWRGLMVSVLLGALVAQLCKYSIARPRPLMTFEHMLTAGERSIYVVGEALQYRSFPSGHAQAAASVLTYLWALYPRYGVWWGVGMVLVGIGRVYVGAHFPADVLVGTCIGGLSTWIVLVLQKKVKGRRRRSG